MGPSSTSLPREKSLTQAQHVSTYCFLIRPDCPNPQSQSLSRSYGSDLPTSLTYIVLSTRGFSPRRPAADMGTNWCDTPVSLSWIFKVHQNNPDATITAALFVTITLSLREGIPGRSVTHAEKITLPGSFVGISRSFWVTPMVINRKDLLPNNSVPSPGSGIETRFPFALQH
jgi:hypothetical protein